MVFGLNMAAFATGVFEQSMDNARERKAAEIAQAELDAENKKELAKNSMALIQTLVGDDMLSPIQAAKAAKGVELGMYNEADIYAMAKVVDDTDNIYKYGEYGLNLVQPYDYDTMSGFERSGIFWDSWQKQLSSEKNLQDAISYFELNPEARNTLEAEVKKNEYEFRVGNISRQTAAQIKEEGLKYINLEENYGNATRLFDALGFKNVEEDSFAGIVSKIEDFDYDPENEVAFMVNTREKGGPTTPMPVAVDKNTFGVLKEMAVNQGYDTVQQMAFSTSYNVTARPSGMNDEQFALYQNDNLIKAAQLYSRGFAEFLSNPVGTDKNVIAQNLQKLEDIAPRDKTRQIQILSIMTKTPANIFTKTKRNRYSGNESKTVKPILTGQQFIEKITGLKADDFNEGLKAQEEAVQYLDRLMELEGEITAQVGTGWVRSSAALLARFGIQIQDGPTALGNLFQNNSDFAATAGDTTQQDLQAVIQQVRPEIDLGNISEAEAIRLTLAAKMARAVDPSGRLSNQDFEIQLRRLGDSSFATYDDIITKLKTVRAEFEQDLEYKNILKTIQDDNSSLTPQVARTVQAYMNMRNYEKRVYGARGQADITTQQAGTGDSGDTPPATTQSAPQNLPAYSVNGKATPFFGPDANGQFYTDATGTQAVDSSTFMNTIKGL